MQVPRNGMTVNLQQAPAGVFIDPNAANSKMKRTLPPAAEVHCRKRESLNEALRITTSRKPRGPDLNRHSSWVPGAAVSPRIHQQIAKPPRSAPVQQSHTHKPHFIPAPHRQRGECFV